MPNPNIDTGWQWGQGKGGHRRDGPTVSSPSFRDRSLEDVQNAESVAAAVCAYRAALTTKLPAGTSQEEIAVLVAGFQDAYLKKIWRLP